MKRPVFLGAATALATIAVGVVLVLVIAASTGGTSDKRAAGRGAKRADTSTTSSPPRSTTTTTTSRASSPTSSPASAPASVTPPAAAPTPSATDPPDPPDPADAYQPVPLPTGVSGAITGCSWSPANGGELRANGTVTNVAGEDETWLVTAVWLQRNQTQEEDFNLQSTFLNLAVGQSAPWNLTASEPTAPPNLSCALEIE